MMSLAFEEAEISSLIDEMPITSYSAADLSDVISVVLRLLGTMCFTSAYNSTYLIEELGFDLVVETCLACAVASVRSAACIATCNFITSDRSQIDLILSSSQIVPNVVLRIAQDESAVVRFEALWAMYWLVKSGTFLQVKQALGLNLIEALVNMPESDSRHEDTLIVQLDTVHELIKFGRGTSVGDHNVCAVWLFNLGACEKFSPFLSLDALHVRSSVHRAITDIQTASHPGGETTTQSLSTAEDLLAALVDGLSLS
eukprot:m.42739 g.42739  ORF g.42739 m.42739 type:complete len:257 (+) comp46531_c0_seq1:171-941(+)